MIDDCSRESRVAVHFDAIGVGTVLHSRETSDSCRAWLVIAKIPASPIMGPGWKLMEMGDDIKYFDQEGSARGAGEFTGRSSTLRDGGAVSNFHISTAKKPVSA